MFGYAKSIDYLEDLCIGISLTQTGNDGKYAYSISYNTSATFPHEDEIPDPLLMEVINYKVEFLEIFYWEWLSSGFVTI
jgi:hypothetical protein